MALGLAYAGTAKEDVRELLLPLISVDETNVELVAQASLALGVVFAGTCDGAILHLLQGHAWPWEHTGQSPCCQLLVSKTCTVRTTFHVALEFNYCLGYCD